MNGSKLTHLLRTVRVGRWILCLSRYAHKCKHLVTTHLKQHPNPEQIPGREHVFHHGDYQVILLSTEPMILKPNHSELPAPPVFPVELYLDQLESARGLSECTQYGTSSKRLALELSGFTVNDDLTGNFILHMQHSTFLKSRHC